MVGSRRENKEKRAKRRAKKRRFFLFSIIIILGLWMLGTQFTDVFAALFHKEETGWSNDGEGSIPEKGEEQGIEDTEPPVIQGAKDLEVYIGEPVSFKKDIEVRDNSGQGVELEVDSSLVNLKEEGSYELSYLARDPSGNESSKVITVTVKEKSEGYVSEDEVYALADEILGEITHGGMSQREIAKAIYHWTRGNIGYVNSSEKSDWLKAAYQGFKKRSGDCFVYFSTAQALLHRVGIKNQGIIKTGGGHYWSLVNVGDGWYHFDTTPRIGDDDYFFMLTDEEIQAYSRTHKNSHVWDQSKYPATPK